MPFHQGRQYLKKNKIHKPPSLKANINTWLNILNVSLLCDSLWVFLLVFLSFHCANSTRQLPLSVTFSLSLGRVPEVCSMTSSSASVSIFSLWAWPLLWVNQQALTRATLPFPPLDAHAALPNDITVGSRPIGALLTRPVADQESIWLTGMASHPPIPIMDLADHQERLKANDNLKFSQEYEVSHDSKSHDDHFFLGNTCHWHCLPNCPSEINTFLLNVSC